MRAACLKRTIIGFMMVTAGCMPAVHAVSALGIDDTLVIDEDTPGTINVLANDLDYDGDTLRFLAITREPRHGIAVHAGNGNVQYVPDADYAGTDSLEYYMTDGSGFNSGADVMITVNPVNDAPDAGADFSFTREEEPVVVDVLANDTDVENQRLHIIELGQLEAVTVENPSGNPVAPYGRVELTARDTVVYRPSADFAGWVGFEYVVSDQDGEQDVGTVTVVVENLQDAPVAVDDRYTTVENTASGVDAANGVLANDEDADVDDTLEAVLETGPTDGDLKLNADGSFTYIPDADFFSRDSFTYFASDGTGQSGSATVFIDVTPVNQAPTTRGIQNQDMVEDDPARELYLPPHFTDREQLATTLSYSVISVGNPALFETIAIEDDPGHVLTLGVVANSSGTSAVTVRATDNGGLSVETTFTVTVEAVNDAPVALSDSYTTNEDAALEVSSVLDNDFDQEGEALTASLVDDVDHGTLVLNLDGSFTYTPTPDYNGADTFTYRAGDGNLNTAAVKVTLNVNAVNDAPTTTGLHAVEAAEDAADILVDLLPHFSDIEDPGTELTYSVQSNSNPSLVTPSLVSPFENVLRLSFQPDAYGAATLTLRATDTGGAFVQATLNVGVDALNDPPVAAADTVTTLQDLPVRIPVTKNDFHPDGDDIAVITPVPGDPAVTTARGTVRAVGNFLWYQPDAGETGSDGFNYAIEDPDGEVAVARVTVMIDGGRQVVSASPSWTMSLNPRGAAAEGEIVFGMHLDASNDYDPGLDVGAPRTVRGAVGGRIALIGHRRFVVDIRPPAAPTTWLLEVAAGSAEPLELSWDADAAVAPMLQVTELDSMGMPIASGTNLRMSEANGLSVPAETTSWYEVRYAAAAFDLPLDAGWNLISLPLQLLEQPTEAELRNAGVAAIFQWNGASYERPDLLLPKRAYWIYVLDDRSVLTVTGVPVADTSVELIPGWNLIGPVASAPFAPVDMPILLGRRPQAWQFVDGRYETARKLQPGRGYWIHAAESAQARVGR